MRNKKVAAYKYGTTTRLSETKLSECWSNSTKDWKRHGYWTKRKWGVLLSSVSVQYNYVFHSKVTNMNISKTRLCTFDSTHQTLNMTLPRGTEWGLKINLSTVSITIVSRSRNCCLKWFDYSERRHFSSHSHSPTSTITLLGARLHICTVATPCVINIV